MIVWNRWYGNKQADKLAKNAMNNIKNKNNHSKI